MSILIIVIFIHYSARSGDGGSRYISGYKIWRGWMDGYVVNELIIQLYKAINRPHLECCTTVWRTFRKKDIHMLGQFTKENNQNDT